MTRKPLIQKRCLSLAAILTLAFLASACQSSVSGNVFFDKDGNGTRGSSESGIPFAKLMVTRDDKLVAEHYADASGAFDVPIRSKSGYVCVETDLSFAEANFDYIWQSLGSQGGASAMRVEPPKAQKALATPDDGTDSGEDGTVTPEPEPDTEDNVDTVTMPAGWIGTKYCQNVKFKGFEVDVPVKMDLADALADMPKRLKVDCYAGQGCEVRIPYPKGCTLDPLTLPEGLTLDESESQAGVKSYDQIFNIVNFDEASIAAAKAQAGGGTLAPTGFSMVTLALKADEDVEVGSTEVEIEPSADCFGEELALEEIPVEIIREISVGVYQHLMTALGAGGMLMPGTNASIRVLIENRGRSALTKGDVTFTPPAGSVIQNTAGCLNYGTKMICRVEKIDAGALHNFDITFKLPSPIIDESVSCDATFQAEGMDEAEPAESVMFMIKGTP